MNWWSELFAYSCQGEKPGGLALTRHAAALCGFDSSSKILDLASGDGSTVRDLRKTLGCQVSGLDCDPARESPDVQLGDAAQLPFPDGVFDGVFLECALSQISCCDLVLAQCSRVLKSGGKLVLSDLYTRADVTSWDTPIGRLDSASTLEKRLKEQGLIPTHFEDHSRALTALWAQARMEGQNSQLFSSLVRFPGWKELKCGYYLCIAEKSALC